MIIKPRSIFQIATAAGREYVTPEDVTDSRVAWIAWHWRGK